MSKSQETLGIPLPHPKGWKKQVRSDVALAAFRESCGHGVPMMVNAEPAGGVTAPATLAGELVVGNAEALSGVVICQLLKPGRPLVFNMGFAHVMDMQTTIMRTGASSAFCITARTPSAGVCRAESLLKTSGECRDACLGHGVVVFDRAA